VNPVQRSAGSKFESDLSSTLNMNNILNKNRIATFITKKNVGLIKTANAQRRSTLEAGIMNSLLKFQQQNLSLMMNQSNNNISEKENSEADDNSVSNNNDKSSLFDKAVSKNNSVIHHNINTNNCTNINPTTSSFKQFDSANNYTKMYNTNCMTPGGTNNNDIIYKHIEKCNKDFHTLKEFVIKSFKESFKIQTTFEKIMKDIKDCSHKIEQAKSEIHLLTSPKKLELSISDASLEDVSDFSPTDDGNMHIKMKKRTQHNNRISLKKVPELNNNFLEEIDENEEIEMMKNYTSSINIRDSSVTNAKEGSYSQSHSQVSYPGLNFLNKSKILLKKSMKNVEEMLFRYASTGTASK
jgi:hypothetical protein